MIFEADILFKKLNVQRAQRSKLIDMKRWNDDNNKLRTQLLYF